MICERVERVYIFVIGGHFVGAHCRSPTSHTPASGLVAALGADDWHARRAAALAVRALVQALGPRIDVGQV